MQLNTKNLLYILSIVLFVSLLANVYIFTKSDDDKSGEMKKYEMELSELKKINDDLSKRLSLAQNSKNEKNEKVNKEKKQEVNKDNSEDIDYNIAKEIENTVNRFIEYTFNTNPDNYVDRKKLAKNYMTDNLFDIIFAADGENEYLMNVKLETGNVDVYINNNNEEVIVFYTLEEELLSSGFKGTIENYMKITVIQDENKFKISNVEQLIMNEGGI